jgi:hypothetical protein
MTDAQGFRQVVPDGAIPIVTIIISSVVKCPRDLGNLALAGSTIEMIS